MRKKRKYRKRQITLTVKKKIAWDISEEIKTLINELVTSYLDTLLSIRGDLIRARAQVREKELDKQT